MFVPTVTVVVPMFSDSRRYVNRLPLMRRLWISLKNQLDQDFTLIAVDNCSHDDSVGLFREYFPNWTGGKSLKPVLASHPVPNHRSGSRNLGARMAQSSHLVFMDCDLIAYPNLISNYKGFIRKHPNAIGLGFYYPYWDVVHLGREFIINRNGREMIDYTTMEKSIKIRAACLSDGDRVTLIDRNRKPYDCKRYQERELFSGNFCIPRDIYFKIGGFDEEFRGYGHEDTMFGLVAKANSIEKYILSNVSCIHQNHRLPDDNSWRDNGAECLRNEVLMRKKLKSLEATL